MSDGRETRKTSFSTESFNVWEVAVEVPFAVVPEGGMAVANVSFFERYSFTGI
jgi:hypothetical protein